MAKEGGELIQVVQGDWTRVQSSRKGCENVLEKLQELDVHDVKGLSSSMLGSGHKRK